MNYQLTQTGEQVQDILNQAPTTEETLQAEITRSTNKDDALELAIGNEKTRAEGVESNLQTAIGNEKNRAEGAEANLQTAIGNEKTRAELIEGGLRTDVDGIEAKIPTGASSENKLATEGFVNSSVATNTADFKGTYNSLEALETAVQDANANDYAFVISTDAAGNTVYNRYKYVEGTGWVFEYALNNSSFTSSQWAAINSAITAALVAKLTGLPTATELTTQLNAIIDSVATEKSRAEGIESGLRTDVNANATAIGTEKTRAEGVEGNLSTAIGNEKTRAEAAELLLQQNINAEALLRGNADTALQGEIDGINAKIPAAASSSNQLADKAFVNSSIATNTATFRGTYNSVAALDEVTADNNDYAFVVATDTAGNTVYNRYKYVEGSGWVFEYALNNSSFTSSQWAAINSAITAALVAKLTGLPDSEALAAMFTAITSLIPAAATSDNKLVDYAQLVAGLATKQNTLTFDNVPVENSNNPVKSGGVYSAIATVTAAVVGLQSSKQDVLTFDQYPTAGSNNPVKSTGIYTAIENAVAPKANQTALESEITRAQGAESSMSGRITTNASDIATLQAAYAGLTERDVVVVAPTDTWPVASPQANTIYRVVDRVNTPPQYYSDYMWNGTAMVQMAQYDNAIDSVPTPDSHNLVESGGVAKVILNEYKQNNGIFSFPYLGYLNSSGVLKHASPDIWEVTEYIEVNEGDTFYYAGSLGGSNCNIAAYDSNKQFVSALISGSDIVDKKVTIPSGISYIRACSRIDTAHYLQFTGSIESEVMDLQKKVEGYPFTNNGFIGSNGTTWNPQDEGSGYVTTDFIRVENGEKYCYKGYIGASGLCVAAYSDASLDSYVSTLLQSGVYQGLTEVTIPSGVNYIRACANLNESAASLIKKNVFSFTMLDYLNSKVDINSLFPYLGYIKANGENASGSSYRRTDYLPVAEGEKMYYVGSIGSSFPCVVGYDSNKQFASILLPGASYTTFEQIVIPQGVSYIRAASDKSHIHYLLKPNTIIALLAQKGWDNQNMMLKNEYFGKTVNWIGDSITAGDDFDEIVSSYFGMTENDYGINGSTIAANEGDTRDSIALRYSNMVDNADVIVVSGGTNDYQYNWTPFGQIGDSTIGTFYGALDVLCRGLIAKYPDKIVFFTTPIKRNQGSTSSSTRPLDTAQDVPNELGKYLSDYAQAIKEVCAKYSIPVCDLYSESYLNPNMTAQAGYFDNAGTHPNNTGRVIMARRVKGFMKQLC